MKFVRDLLLTLIFGGFIVELAVAQDYPARLVRIVDGFPPGGSSDLVARKIAESLGERLGVTVMVENRPGATGTIGANAVAKSPPDGHTLLVSPSGTMAAVRHILGEKMPYGPSDLVPVALLAKFPGVLVCHPSLPVKSVKELVALAKARPGEITFASPGVGSGFHLGFEMWARRAGINMMHIPYKGNAPAVVDLVGGHVFCLMNTAITVEGFVKNGRLRAIAVTGDKRFSRLPAIPTLGETVPGFEFAGWAGLFVPKGTPDSIVGLLNSEIGKILAERKVEEFWTQNGWVMPEEKMAKEFAGRIAKDSARYGEIIRELGLKQ